MIPESEKPLPEENEAARIKKIALIPVVDDDAGMLRSYKFMFSSQGWNVKCYSDAASFLEEVTDVPGCLILDVRERLDLATGDDEARYRSSHPVRDGPWRCGYGGGNDADGGL